jgi:toxin-antitoxin system PIN domain toxin
VILLDVNLVVAGFRPSHPHHLRVAPWLSELSNGTERFTVPDTVWASFVRLVTNRRVFEVPDAAAQAFAFVHAVRSAPAYQPIVPGERHLEIFERLCVEGQATGDLVPDAYLASLAIDQGATFATLDRDFARFEGLRTTAPPERDPA